MRIVTPYRHCHNIDGIKTWKAYNLVFFFFVIFWLFRLDVLKARYIDEREAEGSGNVVFEKDAENFVDGEKE